MRAILFSFLILSGEALALTASEQSAINACFRPTAATPCTEGISGPSANAIPGEGYPLTMGFDAKGKPVATGIPSTTRPAEGCYSSNFERCMDDSSCMVNGRCTKNKAYPMRLRLNWKTLCSKSTNSKCVEGATVVVNPQIISDQTSSIIGNFNSKDNIGIHVNSKNMMDQAKEACENLSGSYFTWDSAARICRKKAQYICENELKMKWVGTSETDGKCSAALTSCSEVPISSNGAIVVTDLSSYCGNRNDYCKGYQYMPSTLPSSGQCFCTGTSTTKNKNGKACSGIIVTQATPTPTTPSNTGTGTGTGSGTGSGSSSGGGGAVGPNELVVGLSHGCLNKGGDIWCWGDNQEKQLGQGNTNSYNGKAVQVSVLSNISDIDTSVTSQATCAVTSDGKVVLFGNGGWSSDGDTSYNGNSSFKYYASVSNATGCARGQYHTCAIVANGEVQCYGDNSYGKLGAGHFNTMQGPTRWGELPQYVLKDGSGTRLNQIISVVAGPDHTCALDIAGKVWCWGKHSGNSWDKRLGLGDGVNSDSAIAKNPAGLESRVMTDLRTGYGTTCAKEVSTGDFYCWEATVTKKSGGAYTGSKVVEPSGFARCVIRSDDKANCGNAATNHYLVGNGTQDTPGDNPDASKYVLRDSDDSVLASVLQINAGHTWACALADGCKVHCWGSPLSTAQFPMSSKAKVVKNQDNVDLTGNCGSVPTSCTVGDAWTGSTSMGAGNPSPNGLMQSVWTGSEMLIWGQGISTRYNPTTNSWGPPINTTGAPSQRYGHAVAWTGTEMIIWGRENPNENTGGLYNPTTNTWRTMSTAGAPQARGFSAGVWDGTNFLVFGGRNENTHLADGGRYNPATNTWGSPIPAAPDGGRIMMAGVWTGQEAIFWGGWRGNYSNTGVRFNPSTNTWSTNVSTTGAPSARIYPTGVWTGSEMIIWGGDGKTAVFNNGAIYNPTTDTWRSMTTTNAPAARTSHTAVWTGSEMIVWGGGTYGEHNNWNGVNYNTGGKYGSGCTTSPSPTPSPTPTATPTPTPTSSCSWESDAALEVTSISACTQSVTGPKSYNYTWFSGAGPYSISKGFVSTCAASSVGAGMYRVTLRNRGSVRSCGTTLVFTMGYSGSSCFSPHALDLRGAQYGNGLAPGQSISIDMPFQDATTSGQSYSGPWVTEVGGNNPCPTPASYPAYGTLTARTFRYGSNSGGAWSQLSSSITINNPNPPPPPPPPTTCARMDSNNGWNWYYVPGTQPPAGYMAAPNATTTIQVYYSTGCTYPDSSAPKILYATMTSNCGPNSLDPNNCPGFTVPAPPPGACQVYKAYQPICPSGPSGGYMPPN